MALQSALFDLKAQIIFKLQDIAYQTNDLAAFRESLVNDILNKIAQLDKKHFAVKQYLRYVELYSKIDKLNMLTYEDTLLMKEHIAPLVTPDDDEATALRFDALIYGIELAFLVRKTYGIARSDLFNKVTAIAGVANIPEIKAQTELINKILHTDYIEQSGISEFENIRINLRNLMKYIPKTILKYDTNFTDDVLSIEWNESSLESDDLKNYRAKAEFYIREHENEAVIAKLKSNIPLTKDDLKALEKILWSDVGSKEDYTAEIGEKPLGEFVREIVGLDMNAAKEAFSLYLNSMALNDRQIYFVNQIVEYIVHNGVMKDLSVLQQSPFTDKGSVVDVFDDLTVWMGIKGVIDSINANVAA